MVTNDERREVAENLRHLSYGNRVRYKEEFFELLDDTVMEPDTGYHEMNDVFDRLADLIEQEVACGECCYCIRNERGELWCMRDPNHTGRGIPTSEDGFCAWGVTMEGDGDGE